MDNFINGIIRTPKPSTVSTHNGNRRSNNSNTTKSDRQFSNLSPETTGTTISKATIPLTPALIEITPDPDFEFQIEQGYDETDEVVTEDDNYCQYRSLANQKLAEVIFSHPKSLRSFCVEAYESAKKRSPNQDSDTNEPFTITDFDVNEVLCDESIPEGMISNSIPLSIVMDTWNVFKEISLDFSFATVRITVMIIDASVYVVVNGWEEVTRFNPMNFAYMIIARPSNLMGKTTVVVSGIQSVAGIGSASSIALNCLSAKNHSFSSIGSHGNRRTRSPGGKSVNQQLLEKLTSLNSAASVISYTEIGDNDGGLSRHAKSRVQRMMHYDVSLRPFIATVELQESLQKDSTINGCAYSEDDATSESSSPLNGPFMCTPQSFPPTPASRAHVLKRGSRFADDVVFLARDQLRVHDGLESSNKRTREMAKALTMGKQLAVFDADDAGAGIDLSCGQHVATKVGDLLYCSIRSMVPVLRNCFVYFEMTVLGQSAGGFIPQTSMTMLSFGLSTKEMPLNTLVGVWKGSVGLCKTGQILISGQTSPEPTISPFGDRGTIGCLVCLDDSSAFETWDGVMITATVTFNINGRIVSPHVPRLPSSGLDQYPPKSIPDVPIGIAAPSFTLPLLVPAEEELYPTLTLHSPGTSVMSRFSAGDILAKSREDIGAPPNVTVYTVDGSLVFKGEE